MSDAPQGPGWWLASDGRYYPPQPPEAPSAPPTADHPPEPGQAWAPPTGAVGGPGSPPPWPAPVAAPGEPGAPVPSGSTGSRTVLIVLAVVVGAAVFGVVALFGAVALLRGDRSETEAAEPTELTTPTTTPPLSEPAPPSVPSGSGGTPGTAGPVRVTESGFTTGEGFDGALAANAGAVLDNTGSDTHAFFEVVFTFVGADGRPVGTETSYVYAIDPGGTAHASVDAVSLQGPASEVRVSVVLDDVGFWSGSTLPVTVGTVAVDDFFGLEVAGTASNPGDTTAQGASVQCVVRQGGRIVGGTSALLDSIEPGGQVAWEAITFSDFLRGDRAECSGSVYE